jgi:hypothetical protein
MANIQQQSAQSGYITLLTVLVVGAVGVAISTSLLLLGLANSRTSFALVQSKQAAALADDCAEEALQQMRFATSYTGTATLTLGTGTCNYTVTAQTGENRDIQANGTVGTIVRHVHVTVSQLTPTTVISLWQEVAHY